MQYLWKDYFMSLVLFENGLIKIFKKINGFVYYS